MSRSSVLPAAHHLIVAIYLTAAGWFFVLAPWSSYWAKQVVASAPIWLSPFLADPSIRGALSAFGVLHFAVAYGWLNAATPKP